MSRSRLSRAKNRLLLKPEAQPRSNFTRAVPVSETLKKSLPPLNVPRCSIDLMVWERKSLPDSHIRRERPSTPSAHMALTRPVVPPDGSFISSNPLILLDFGFSLCQWCVSHAVEQRIVDGRVGHRVRIGLHEQRDVIPTAVIGGGLGIDAVAQHGGRKTMADTVEGQPLKIRVRLGGHRNILPPMAAQPGFRQVEQT